MKNVLNSLSTAKFAFAFAALMAFTLVSCSDTSSPISSSTDTSILEHGGKGANGDSTNLDKKGKHGDKKGGRKDALPLPCLELTADQLAQLETLKTEQRTALTTIQDEYKAKVEAELQSQKTALTDLEAQIKAIREQKRTLEKANYEANKGNRATIKTLVDELKQEYKVKIDLVRQDAKNQVITREEAQSQIRTLTTEMNAEIKVIVEANKGADVRDSAEWQALNEQEKALLAQLKVIRDEIKTAVNAINAELKTALDAVKADFLTKVREILTDEQKAIWDEWLATGKGC